MKDSFSTLFNLTNEGLIDLHLENWILYKELVSTKGIDIILKLDTKKKNYVMEDEPLQQIVFMNYNMVLYIRNFISQPILFNTGVNYDVTIGNNNYKKTSLSDWTLFFKSLVIKEDNPPSKISLNIKMIIDNAVYDIEQKAYLNQSSKYLSYLEKNLIKQFSEEKTKNKQSEIYIFFNLSNQENFPSLRLLSNNLLMWQIIVFTDNIDVNHINQSFEYRFNKFSNFNKKLKTQL